MDDGSSRYRVVSSDSIYWYEIRRYNTPTEYTVIATALGERRANVVLGAIVATEAAKQ